MLLWVESVVGQNPMAPKQNSTLFWILVVVLRQQASVSGMTYADTTPQSYLSIQMQSGFIILYVWPIYRNTKDQMQETIIMILY